jgi:DNA-binding helix-hairpin-helix protein with protein kinase domain
MPAAASETRSFVDPVFAGLGQGGRLCGGFAPPHNQRAAPSRVSFCASRQPESFSLQYVQIFEPQLGQRHYWRGISYRANNPPSDEFSSLSRTPS